MLNALRQVAQVLLGVALLEVALSAFSPLVTLQLHHRDVSTETIGIITSCYYVGFVLGTVTCFPIIDRVRHVRGFCVFTVVATIATLLHVVIQDPIAWMILRAIIGYALAGVFTIVESWLNDKATTETRGRIFALYTAVAWAMSSIGPLGLNLKDPDGTILFALITAVMVSAIIPLALTTVGNPEIGHRTHFGIRRLYKVSPVGVLACFSSGFVNTAIFGLLPVYCNKLGYSDGQISIILSISVLAGFVIQYPIGWLADSLGRRPLMLATTLAALSLSVWIVNLPDDSFWWLVGLTFALTGMISPLYGLGVGQTNDYVERKDFVAASAGLLFAWGIGASIGPAVAAPAMTRFGPQGLFYFVTAYHVALTTFILYRMLARRALRAKEQGNFVAVPVTQATYGAPELDPRGAMTPSPAAASKTISETVD